MSKFPNNGILDTLMTTVYYSSKSQCFYYSVTAETLNRLADFEIEDCTGTTDSETEQEIENFISCWLVEHAGGVELPKWCVDHAKENYADGSSEIAAICDAILEFALWLWMDSKEYDIYDGMPGSGLVMHSFTRRWESSRGLLEG